MDYRPNLHSPARLQLHETRGDGGKAIRGLGWMVGLTLATLTALALAGPSQAARTGFVSTWNPANTNDNSSSIGNAVKAANKKQTLKTKLPKRIRLSGLTAITPKNTDTNAGSTVRTRIRGGPIKPSAAGEVRYFTVVRGPAGKTSIRTYGYPNLKLRVTQDAPATLGYTAFTLTATYVRGKRS